MADITASQARHNKPMNLRWWHICFCMCAEDGQCGYDQAQATVDKTPTEAASRAALAPKAADLGQIMRAKGFVWLAGRDRAQGGLQIAGRVGQLLCAGYFAASIPKSKWPKPGTLQRKNLDKHLGSPVVLDRRQELVFIGRELKKDKIAAALDACLMRKDEAIQNVVGRYHLQSPRKSSKKKATKGKASNDSMDADVWKLGCIADSDYPIPQWPDFSWLSGDEP